MARRLEIRRHTDNDGDVLTDRGVEAAVAIGRSLTTGFDLAVSSGAQRATQTIACILAGQGRAVAHGVVVEPGLRSDREDEWRAAYREAGSGELAAFRGVAPDLVAEESVLLGAALRRILERLDDGESALVVGHSPTNEAAILGLTGAEVHPMGKGAGVVVTSEGDGWAIEVLP